MAEVVLFRPKASEEEVRAIRPRPPLGLLFVAAPLVANNYKVKIIDEETSFYRPQDLHNEIDGSTICVGVSSMTGWQILGGLKFAKIIKERYDIPVVWGGLHASMLPEQTLKNNLVDIVVRGEGEDSFLKIVNALKYGRGLGGIPNVWWKKDGRIYINPEDGFVDLNSLPPLPYQLLNYERYIGVKRSSHPGCKRIMDLQTDRGCPHRCGFCYNISINRYKWRDFDAARVIEDIDYLVKKFSLDGINFISDNFFVDKGRVADICEGIIKRKIRISWHADCRIDYFSKYEDSFIGLLKESGCKMFTFGIESGSPRVLGLIHKDITLDDIFKVNKKLKKWRIGVSYHFMAGFPEENKDDLIQTYRVMLKLYGDYPAADFLGPSIYTPYPGTPLYQRCIELGFQPPRTLQDWANFGWTEKTRLSFIAPDYFNWMMKTVNVISNISVAKRIFGAGWIGWWFKLRTELIVRFNIVGPRIEEKLISFAAAAATLLKKLIKRNKN